MGSIKRNNSVVTPKRPKGYGKRHTVVILGFWAMCILYALRFNLSIAIVAMVKSEDNSFLGIPRQSSAGSLALSLSDTTQKNVTRAPQVVRVNCLHLKRRFDPCFESNTSQACKNSTLRKKAQAWRRGEFNWSREEQGVILSSFFWGHVLTQIPGGMLAQRYGPKWPLGLGILLTSLLALVTPVAARLSVTALIVVRVLQGLVGGVVWPAMHLLLGKWAPPDERSKLVSIVYAGPQFGSAAATVACGYLISGNVMGGWPSAFYVLGSTSLVWFGFWIWLMYDAPSKHPTITSEELVYIEASIGLQCSGKKLPTPWKSIFASIPLWAILVAHVGEDYGLYTLLTELPTYLKTVLHFKMRENSWMSALPQLVRWFFSIAITFFADYLIHKRILRTVTVRKLCNTIAFWGAAVSLMGVSYLGCDPVMTVVVLTLGVGISGAVNGGCITNHVDIAANHAGILMGITNTAANTCGIIAPFVAGLLTNEAATIDRWQIVFFITAAVYFVSNSVYLIFASASEQTWNRGGGEPSEEEMNANDHRMKHVSTVEIREGGDGKEEDAKEIQTDGI